MALGISLKKVRLDEIVLKLFKKRLSCKWLSELNVGKTSNSTSFFISCIPLHPSHSPLNIFPPVTSTSHIIILSYLLSHFRLSSLSSLLDSIFSPSSFSSCLSFSLSFSFSLFIFLSSCLSFSFSLFIFLFMSLFLFLFLSLHLSLHVSLSFSLSLSSSFSSHLFLFSSFPLLNSSLLFSPHSLISRFSSCLSSLPLPPCRLCYILLIIQ